MTDLRIESHDESYPPSLWGGGSNPTPVIGSIAPNTAVVNVFTTYTVTGTGFTASSQVKLDGNPVPTTFVDSTHVTFGISALTIGVKPVTVTTDGKVSAPVNVTITATQADEQTTDDDCPTEPEGYGEPIPVEELPE
jgi:hypothetical protein